VNGDGNQVLFAGGSDDVASLGNTESSGDVVTGSDGGVVLFASYLPTLATVSGSDDWIAFQASADLSLVGNQEVLKFQQGIGGLETISGFNATDTIELSASDFANFAALSAHLSQSGADAMISLDANDSIKLSNVLPSSLAASDFRFV
jgi:hypothetical protein